MEDRAGQTEPQNRGTPRVRRQHYVPQFYLRRFTFDGERLHVYDKFRARRYVSSVANLATETGFYDFPHAIGDTQIVTPGNVFEDPQYLERVYARLETFIAGVVDSILLRLASGGAIPAIQRVALAMFIQNLHTRTSAYRAMIDQMFREAPDLLIKEGRDPFEYRDRFSDEVVAILHSALMAPAEFQQETYEVADMIWIFGETDPEAPLYSSDNPVGAGQSVLLHLSGSSSHFALPLSPEYVLMAYGPDFVALEDLDDEIVPLNKKDVATLNSWQVAQSHRQVFCSTDAWRTAERVCERFPHLGSPDRRWIPANWREYVSIDGTDAASWNDVLGQGTPTRILGESKGLIQMVEHGQVHTRDGTDRPMHYNCLVHVTEILGDSETTTLEVGRAYLACIALDDHQYRVNIAGTGYEVNIRTSMWLLEDACGYFPVDPEELADQHLEDKT